MDETTDDFPPELENEYKYVPKDQFLIPQEMVALVAQGMEDPAEVAARFGVTGEKWEKLQSWKPFLDAVAAHRAELEASGYVLQTKLKWMASDITEDLYIQARAPQASIAQKLETAKFLTKLAGMEPKDGQAKAGEGFQITINLNGSQTTVSGVVGPVIDAEEVAPSGAKADKGYYIEPLVDPALFVEMARNQEEDV